MSASPYIVDVTAANFSSAVVERSYQVPVMVDFWASWCGPCKMLMPVVIKLADEFRGQFVLAKINIDEQQELATRFGVRSVPTVKIVRNGRVVDEFLGAQPESEIRRIIDRHIEKESDRVLDRALDLARVGDTGAALEVIDALLASEPDNNGAKLTKAEVLLAADEVDAAAAVIAALPAEVRGEPEARLLSAQIAFWRVAQDAPPQEALAARLKANPADAQARHQLGALLIMAGDYEAALEQFLELMRRDRAYGEDAGRKALLQVFELLGGEGELVAQYRRRMAAALY